MTGRPMSANQSFAKRTGTNLSEVMANTNAIVISLEEYKLLREARPRQAKAAAAAAYRPVEAPFGVWCSASSASRSRAQTAYPRAR